MVGWICRWWHKYRLNRAIAQIKMLSKQNYRRWISPLLAGFDRWIHPWITRANGVYLVGCLLLLQGVKHGWYQLPDTVVTAFDSSQFWVQPIPRFGVGTFILLGVTWLLWQWPRIIPRVPYWSALFATLLFPFWLTTAAPSLTYLATSFNAQNLEVVRHIEKKFPEVQSQWKQNIAFDQTRPIDSIFAFNIENRKFFQFSAWERVVLDGFGYRNPVFDFIGKGWGVTVSGLVVSLIGVYMQHRHQALQLFHQDMKQFLPVAALFLSGIVVYLIGINVANHQIAAEMGRGHYGSVVAQSEQLSTLYPPLRGDEAFLRRWATASVQINQPSESLVNFVKGVDYYRIGDFLEAKSYLTASLEINPKLFLARGYLAGSWINEGIEYSKRTDRPRLPVYSASFPKKNNFLDSAQSNERANLLRATGASQYFEAALDIFPHHIAADYDLMLMKVMNGEFEASAQIADHHIDMQQHFQHENVALLGQAYLHKSWADYHAGDMAATWRRFRQSRNSKTWGDVIERTEPSITGPLAPSETVHPSTNP